MINSIGSWMIILALLGMVLTTDGNKVIRIMGYVGLLVSLTYMLIYLIRIS